MADIVKLMEYKLFVGYISVESFFLASLVPFYFFQVPRHDSSHRSYPLPVFGGRGLPVYVSKL